MQLSDDGLYITVPSCDLAYSQSEVAPERNYKTLVLNLWVYFLNFDNQSMKAY